ncbi:MAG: methyltransferase [Desulfuromonadales bacterium]
MRLSITTQKKSYCTADIVELVSPSPSRTPPECPIFHSCGGCCWQHISYPVQLEQKRLIFADTLWRGARVGSDRVSDMVAAPLLYGYRSRVQFKVSTRRGRLQIGFFRHGSHVIEDAIEGCPVAVQQINDMLKSFRTVLPACPEQESIPAISIDASERGVVSVVHYTGQNNAKISSFLIDRLSDVIPCAGLFLQTGRKPFPVPLWGDSEISYLMPEREPDRKPVLLAYQPGGFAQVNQSQNRALLSVIRRLGNFKRTDNLLDLYCGNGNFSIPLAADVASVVGVEGLERSINSALLNRAGNDVDNAEFICLDVCTALRRFAGIGRMFDVVLLDPPRTGAGDAVPDIARLSPGRIIYVSCDPATLARDCGILATHRYRVAESVPVDMFPQTYHLESVTLLVKTDDEERASEGKPL